MPKIPKIKIAAAYLLKLAEAYEASEENQTHEQAETPEQEALEHLQGEDESLVAEHPQEIPEEEPQETAQHEQIESLGTEQNEQQEDSLDDASVEQMLSQMSPEQLDHLAEQLSAEIQHPEQHEGEDTAALAQAIQEHLNQTPAADAPEATPEKLAGLRQIKSAEYIEGFLNEALAAGISIKQAVDIYDNVLVDAVKLAKDKDHEKEESKKEEKLEHLLGEEKKEEVEKAAYFQGLVERSREYGFSDNETLLIAKQAGLTGLLRKAKDLAKDTKLVKTLKALKSDTANAAETAKGKVKSLFTTDNKRKNPFKSRLSEEGVYYNSSEPSFLKKKSELDDKQAAYYSGVYSRGADYGLSLEEINSLIKGAGIRENIRAAKALGNQVKKPFARTALPKRGPAPSAYEAAIARADAAAKATQQAEATAAKSTASGTGSTVPPNAAGARTPKAKASNNYGFDDAKYEAYREASNTHPNLRTPEQKALIAEAEQAAAMRMNNKGTLDSDVVEAQNAATQAKKNLEEAQAANTAESAKYDTMQGNLNEAAEAQKQLAAEQLRAEAQRRLRDLEVNKGKVKGMSRKQQNELVTQLHGGQAPTAEDTFMQYLEGTKGPRMRGLTHNIAARLGQTGKTMADNPLTTALALGAGTAGVASGLSHDPYARIADLQQNQQYHPYR